MLGAHPKGVREATLHCVVKSIVHDLYLEFKRSSSKGLLGHKFSLQYNGVHVPPCLKITKFSPILLPFKYSWELCLLSPNLTYRLQIYLERINYKAMLTNLTSETNWGCTKHLTTKKHILFHFPLHDECQYFYTLIKVLRIWITLGNLVKNEVITYIRVRYHNYV